MEKEKAKVFDLPGVFGVQKQGAKQGGRL